MKRFLTISSIFATTILLFLLALEIAVTAVPNPYREKANYINEHGKQIETLILGSSHTLMGINPALFQGRAYSLANVSQTINIDDKLLERYIDKMPNLRQVVVPISLFSFYSNMLDSDNGDNFRVTYYQKYMDIDLVPWYKSRIELVDRSNAKSKLIAYYINNDDCIEITEFGQSTTYYLSNKTSHSDWENLKQRAAIIDSYKPENAQLVESLDRIASLCQSRGVELILVTTPIRESYSKLVNVQLLAQMYQQIAAVIKKYDNVCYYDFMRWSDFQLNDDYFYDADHLTDVGANYLTKLLVDTLSKR